MFFNPHKPLMVDTLFIPNLVASYATCPHSSLGDGAESMTEPSDHTASRMLALSFDLHFFIVVLKDKLVSFLLLFFCFKILFIFLTAHTGEQQAEREQQSL